MTSQQAILPLAIVMVAGPQILSSIFLATSETARKSSLAYVVGVGSAVTLGVTIAYFSARALGASTRSHQSSSGNSTVDLVIIALLLVLLIYVFLNRKNVKPPKWMGRLQTAQPRFALGLGFLLFIVMPTDVITMITVGSFQAAQKAPWWHNLYFIALTVFLIALPLLVVVAFGHRAQAALPKLRDWMSSNSWVVNELVIVLFLGITISNL